MSIAQSYDSTKLYEFQSGASSHFTANCGEVSPNGWLVSKQSCNLNTSTITIPESDNNRPGWVIFETTLQNSSNLKPRDFAWIFYYVNDKVMKSVTLRGDEVQGERIISDSLKASPKAKIRMRISFVCDEQDEFWHLPDGGISFRLIEGNNNEMKTVQKNNSLLRAIYTDDIANITWKIANKETSSYYLVERLINNSDYSFVGYVKKAISKDGFLIYSFSDNIHYTEGVKYKVTEFTESGRRIATIGESTLVLEEQ